VANLEVALVWISLGYWKGTSVLDDTSVKTITSALQVEGSIVGSPLRLVSNSKKSFNGSKLYGLGFVLEHGEAEGLLALDEKNREVIWPYLTGKDLTERPDQLPTQWVIHFDERSEDEAKNYPAVWRIAEERIKPYRMTQDPNKYPRMVYEWWKHWNNRQELRRAIAGKRWVLAVPSICKFPYLSPTSPTAIFDHNLTVVTTDSWASFSATNSSLHMAWSAAHSSTLETRLGYRPSDCYETFPFAFDSDEMSRIGQAVGSQRKAIMMTRGEGLTKAYNRYHDSKEAAEDIERLRALQMEMDIAAASAYGWQDLNLAHGFHETKQGIRYTISEAARREVLDRLLALNHQRHAEEEAEKAALPNSASTKRGRKPKDTGGQITMDL
jgi:hypothetical protein